MNDELHYRTATIADLSAIVALLADDAIGATREVVTVPIDRVYVDAFAAIEADANQMLLIVERSGRLIGCLQLSFVPGLSRCGMWRGQIEGVRVATSERGFGVGGQLMKFAIGICRSHGCGLVQLTSDKARDDALRFYESLGFEASHQGMKLSL